MKPCMLTPAGGSRSSAPVRSTLVSYTQRWRSTRSCVEDPISWQLEVPSAGLFLHVTACFADQELITIFSDPGFWDGRVDVLESYQGHAAIGLGWAGLCWVEWSARGLTSTP